MKSYAAVTLVTLKLSLRERTVLFFNYVFPLIFFFLFGQFAQAQGAPGHMIGMVLVFAILGNGLFGAGVRTVADREANVLRRFKVAPITPVPLLVASMITGWVLMLPLILLTVFLAHFMYGAPWPANWLPLFFLISLGTVAMRAIGLIVASVANTVSESNILVQLLYIPMLFLSGVTVPLSAMPGWANTISKVLPSTYLFNGVQSLLAGGGLGEALPSVVALLITTAVGTVVSMQLFRWEKGEPLPARAKVWIAAVFAPFVVLGISEYLR
jgi:ABC-type multidrug transport system permease subunit